MDEKRFKVWSDEEDEELAREVSAASMRSAVEQVLFFEWKNGEFASDDGTGDCNYYVRELGPDGQQGPIHPAYGEVTLELSVTTPRRIDGTMSACIFCKNGITHTHPRRERKRARRRLVLDTLSTQLSAEDEAQLRARLHAQHGAWSPLEFARLEGRRRKREMHAAIKTHNA